MLTPVADHGDMSPLLAVALGAEITVKEVNVALVASPVIPTTGLVWASGDLRAIPLEPVAEPEAGLIPSVPGFIVGNDEELPASVIVEIGTPADGVVLLRDVDLSGDAGSVGTKPET